MKYGAWVGIGLLIAATSPILASVGSKINQPVIAPATQASVELRPEVRGHEAPDGLRWVETVEAITSYYQPTPISEDLIAPWVTQVNACVALADLQRPPTQSVDLWVRNYPDTLSVEDVMIQLIDAEVVSPTGAVLGIRVSPNAEFSGTVFSPMWQRIQTVALPVTGNMADRLRQNLGDLLMVSQ